MRGTLRGLVSLAPVMVLAVACGSDPQPLSGHIYWSDGCALDAAGSTCPTANHSVAGSAGSSSALIDCTVEPAAGGGTHIILNAASLQAGQSTFDETSEGIAVNGTVPGSGQLMDTGTVQIQGFGWQVPGASIGALGRAPCQVYVDSLSGQNIRGRIRCDGAMDTRVPARLRYIHGTPGVTAGVDFADFSFSNCGGAP